MLGSGLSLSLTVVGSSVALPIGVIVCGPASASCRPSSVWVVVQLLGVISISSPLLCTLGRVVVTSSIAVEYCIELAFQLDDTCILSLTLFKQDVEVGVRVGVTVACCLCLFHGCSACGCCSSHGLSFRLYLLACSAVFSSVIGCYCR